ncbi:lycopene cyclase domain-containing protein [Sunxiuqinia sp. A32]|uniref:lycopene cyclase domain-containing protein n=1 Tax=Sunxiuqinia sp. A32 TaxID=3461496 RepID=UPI004045BC62
MELKNYTYLGLLFLTFIFPFVLSFDKKVHFWKNWKYLFPSILITAVIFLIWDVKFTEAGIWSFNHEYTLDLYIKGMPIEEWLFFLVIPYACVFIYEVMKAYFNKISFPNVSIVIGLLLIVAFGALALFNTDRYYTLFNYLFAAIYLAYIIFRNQHKHIFSHFYLAYLISLIPFLLVNGILTYLPVVEYNQAHILNQHVFSIPVEDFTYFFLLLLMNVSIYESLKSKMGAKG